MKNINNLEIMAPTDLKIERVMSRGNFEHPCAKVLFHRIISNDRNFSRLQRSAYFSALQAGPALILRMDGEGDIAHDGFRAGGGYLEILAGRVHQFIADFVKFTVLRLHDHFLIGKGRAADWAPIDHPFSTVDIAVVKEADKCFEHCFGVIGIQGVDRAFPVAGTAQFTKLLEDDSAMLIAPFLGMFEEALPTEIVLTFSFLPQLLFDLGLGGNAGVVGSREPKNGVTLLTCPAGKNILNGVIEHMSHGQHPSHIGWRDDDGVRGLFRIRVPLKGTVLFPGMIEAVLHLFWLICFFHWLDRKRLSLSESPGLARKRARSPILEQAHTRFAEEWGEKNPGGKAPQMGSNCHPTCLLH